MKKTLKIEGMMCAHCEARVKKTLESLEQVSEANVSHTDGVAIITLVSDIPDMELKSVIETDGYKLLGIE